MSGTPQPSRLSELRTRLLVGAGAGVIHSLYSTLNVVVLGKEHVLPYHERREPYLYAFWHNRLLFMCYMHDGPLKPYALISQHGDGELIARIVERFGFGTVRGSTTRGGVGALKACMKLARQGAVIGVTPDGPRGPRYAVQPGIIGIAQFTGLPIFPVCFSASRYWQLRSWDRFQVPQPFSTGCFLFGEPLFVPRESDPGAFEYYRAELERRMREQVRRGDELVRGLW